VARPVVALLTDFGSRDGYVGSMKGVLVSDAPDAQIVDITHEVPPGDVLAAAWILATAWRSFPTRTVFLCVVDPGVGSARRGVAVAAQGMLLVGPDNGVFTLLTEEAGGVQAVELTRPELWRQPPSPVFHGRDIFAPVAAALARGTPLENVGQPVRELHALPVAKATRQPDGSVLGHVIHIDRFGNCITDIGAALLPERPFVVRVAGKTVGDIVQYYAQGPEDRVAALVNSSGYLEIAVRGSSAADALQLRRGDGIEVRPRD
jgi:S-adenosyl-L-methionine hydrolase (adenosine-forming)